MEACFGLSGSSSPTIIYSQGNKDNQERVADCTKTPVDYDLRQKGKILLVGMPGHRCSYTLYGFVESTVSAQSLGIISQSSNCPITHSLEHGVQ